MQFQGKKGLIVGVANDHSIAWAIAQQIMDAGGQCGFTHLPDRPDDPRERNRRRVSQLTDKYENAAFLLPMDAQKDDDIRTVMDHTAQKFGKIDFLLHSIAFADRDDLARDTVQTSRQGFQLAMDVSVYTLLALANAAAPIMNPGGAIAAMTYFGGEKCVPGYNVMGICKAALEAAVQGELERVSQTLTTRVRQLAERYDTPLPQLSRQVEKLSTRVDEHLKTMGVAW